MLTDPTVADRSVGSLNVGILLGLAWLDIFDPNPFPGSPLSEVVTDELRPVVAAYHCRFTPPFEQLIERPDYPNRRQREARLNYQAFSTVVVDDIE